MSFPFRHFFKADVLLCNDWERIWDTSLREFRVLHFPDALVIKKLLLGVGGALEYIHRHRVWSISIAGDMFLNPSS